MNGKSKIKAKLEEYSDDEHALKVYESCFNIYFDCIAMAVDKFLNPETKEYNTFENFLCDDNGKLFKNISQLKTVTKEV